MPETVSNPGRAPKRTATTRWRLYAALVVFAMLPLVLFLYVADWYLRRDFIRGLPPQTQRAAEIVGKLLDDKLTDVKSSLEAIAANPATFDAWDRGNSRILLSQLQEASRLRRDAAFFAIYDSSGSRQMIYPNAAGLNANASAEWFQAALQSSSPYISSMVPAPGASHQQAVMVAVPLHGHGHSGLLAGAYTLDTLKGWFNGVSPGISKWTTVVDQKGAVIIGPDADIATAQHSRVDAEDIKKILARQGGTELTRREGRQLLVTRYPLSWGWGLLVQIPGPEIDKTIWQFERPIA